MKVTVYATLEGEMSALVEASPGKGRAPVLLQGITPANVVESVKPVVEAMRRPKQPKPVEPQ